MQTWIRQSVLALAIAGVVPQAAAHRPPGASAASELSALSMLPIAVSVAAPLGVLVAGAALSVVAVEAVADGTLYVLERASDGARASLVLSGQALAGASQWVGSAIVVSALGTGWLLAAAGQAIAFVPNEIGRSLLHHERITR